MAGAAIAYPYDDYAQSANVLFHFVKKPKYIEDILRRRALVPRYCLEDVGYLGLKVGERDFEEILILQKCFCDIPIPKLMQTFPLSIVDESKNELTAEDLRKLSGSNTHPDCYGPFAVGFSKKWGEERNLQPVQYINSASEVAQSFTALFADLSAAEELPDEYAEDILRRLSFMKPLRGTMQRSFDLVSGNRVDIRISKNFHDEQEWRFVPPFAVLKKLDLKNIIANPNMLRAKKAINENLENERYKELWMDFDYDDIRYLIVPDSSARLELIEFIMGLEVDAGGEQALREKHVLISKILVLNEIRKDW